MYSSKQMRRDVCLFPRRRYASLVPEASTHPQTARMLSALVRLLLVVCLLGALPILSSCVGTGPATKVSELEAAYEQGSSDVYLFTDSAGRDVVLPREVTGVSPSGAYAQLLLSTLCPDVLISLSSRFSETQLEYLDPHVQELPILGRFYGKNADLNYEEIIRMAPDIIIDIGEEKADIAEDMNTLQEQTGIPVIFVEATLTHVNDAYRTLGSILGVEDRAEELASYVDRVLDFAEQHHDEIAAQGLRVMYSDGPYGYEVKEAGSVHAAVLDLVGVVNVADLSGISSTEVSPEQVMIWQPEVLLLGPTGGFYSYIFDDAVWADIPAVKNGRVYEVPGEPYEWLDKPPSIQTILGILWVGNLLYPDIYDYDMVDVTKDFYSLFWSYDLSDEDAARILHLDRYE